MPENRELLQSFIKKVKTEIKSKEAQALVEQELLGHIEEQNDSLKRKGHTEEEACKLAIEQMGNPIMLGQEMNQLHRPRVDWSLFFLFTAIIVMSLIPMYTLSTVIEGLFERKMVFNVIGIVIVLSVMLFDYRKLERLGVFLYGSTTLLLIYIFFYGAVVAGKKFLVIGNFSLDITFTLFLLYVAWSSLLQQLQFKRMFMLTILFLAPIGLYIINGYYIFSIMYFIAVLVMLNVNGRNNLVHKKFIWLSMIGAFILSNIYWVIAPPHQKERFVAFLNPEQYRDTWGYVTSITKEMIAGAGWFGQGNVYEQVRRLPEAHTDLIFPYIIYVFGWGGGILLTFLLGLLVFRIVKVSCKTKHSFGKNIVIGGGILLAFPILVNTLMSLGFLPVVSIHLPFMSYGGTHLLSNSIIVGLILSVYRRKDLIMETKNY
ncbi:FtsW/RodA/SpoVE family cell cycle protein [Alkalihalobacterium alkalinitrilicum]|uniref:FtsW/RodA/SpoVE family cell cycle protein n=1 Tax=Alkalihalobacterium alkalinitrilicum TaxID=427920 RepID=UPI0009949B37|nr:FtsW/RodA/SpoVE family cell cycle protein [Alkalihalobacterium alkalinitrilicum]